MVYLDDILIFSNKREEHLEHVEMVLRNLHEEKLAIDLEKCEFMKKELVYLIFVVSKGYLLMN